MIANLEQRVDAFFGRISHDRPFLSVLFAPIKDTVLKYLSTLRSIIEEIVAGTRYEENVDLLIAFLKGNVKLPLYLYPLKPFLGYVLDGVGSYLKANKDKFVEKLLTSEGPKVGF